jgi:hypothetical protein
MPNENKKIECKKYKNWIKLKDVFRSFSPQTLGKTGKTCQGQTS